MLLRKNVVIPFVLSVMLLASCSGGTIGGLIPAPKMLKGSVDGDYYTSKGGEFSVQLPYPPSASDTNRYEWKYAQVREIEDGPVIGVVIGPAAFNKNMYHSVLIKAPMLGEKNIYAKDIFSKKAASRSEVYSLMGEGTFQENDKNTYYSIYESESFLLLLTLVDNGDNFYVIEADYIKSNSGSPTVDSLLSKSWGVVGDMISSFKINNN